MEERGGFELSGDLLAVRSHLNTSASDGYSPDRGCQEESRTTDWASQIAPSDLFVAPTTSFKRLHGRVIPLHGLRRAATSSSKSASCRTGKRATKRSQRGAAARQGRQRTILKLAQQPSGSTGTSKALAGFCETRRRVRLPQAVPLSGPSSDWAQQSPPLRLNSPAERDRECEREVFPSREHPARGANPSSASSFRQGVGQFNRTQTDRARRCDIRRQLRYAARGGSRGSEA
jgi:hypothetical protein